MERVQRLFGAASPQTADERISQSIRAIPLARLREAGLVELLSSIDAMNVEELLRHARTTICRVAGCLALEET